MKNVQTVAIAFLFSLVLMGCKGNREQNSYSTNTKLHKDSNLKKQAASIANKTNQIEDSEPSFGEVKNELVSRYDKIERIDTTLVVAGDSLKVHEQYYCLKDNTVIVPKKYVWGGDTTKDFITYSFVSHIVIIKNKDTIINKVFRKSDFNNVVNPEERKYAIIFSANFNGYNKKYNSIIFSYSITIPLTDVGVSALIAINKNGEYKMLGEYAKLDDD